MLQNRNVLMIIWLFINCLFSNLSSILMPEVDKTDTNLSFPKQPETRRFREEAENCAALDTCCTSSVTGEQWLNIFINSLDDSAKSKLRGPLPSNRVFKFGNNGTLRSIGTYILPVVIAGKNATIKTDVVESDIPLLLSKVAITSVRDFSI